MATMMAAFILTGRTVTAHAGTWIIQRPGEEKDESGDSVFDHWKIEREQEEEQKEEQKEEQEEEQPEAHAEEHTEDQTGGHPEDTAEESSAEESPVQEDPRRSFGVKEIGEIEDGSNAVFEQGGALAVSRGSACDFIDIHGNTVVEDIAGMESLFDNYVIVAKNTGDENNRNVVGLYTLEGEEVIPCEAASISVPSFSEDWECRFIKVIYVTGTTENEEDCILYDTDSIISLSPGEGDTMYKGYFKVFDLQERRFAGDQQFTETQTYALQECGESYFIHSEDRYTLYDREGKELASFPAGRKQGIGRNCYAAGTGDGSVVVYDDKGMETYRSGNCIIPLSHSDHDYLTIEEGNSGKKYVIDRYGRRVVNYAFESSVSEYGNVFKSEDSTGKNILVDLDGNVIVAAEGDINHQAEDYFLCEMNGEKYALYNRDGLVVDSLSEPGYHLVFSRDDHLCVLNTGEFSVSCQGESPSTLFCGIVRITHEGTSTVYDLFTGNTLVSSGDCWYTYAVGNYLVQKSGNVWHVSQILYGDEPLQASWMAK